jgi:hypothetical protein
VLSRQLSALSVPALPVAQPRPSLPPHTQVNNQNTPLAFPFVTAMVKGGTNGFALKGGDATQPTLTKMYDGPRPNGYQPMKKVGAGGGGGPLIAARAVTRPPLTALLQTTPSRPPPASAAGRHHPGHRRRQLQRRDRPLLRGRHHEGLLGEWAGVPRGATGG